MEITESNFNISFLHMPVDPGSGGTGQTHLVSLVLQSKKALQHGEQLCTRAHTASNTSAQAAVDVLALDAKIRWMVEAVVEQLKVGSCVRFSFTSIKPPGFSLRQVSLRVLKRNAHTCSSRLMFVFGYLVSKNDN